MAAFVHGPRREPPPKRSHPYAMEDFLSKGELHLVLIFFLLEVLGKSDLEGFMISESVLRVAMGLVG